MPENLPALWQAAQPPALADRVTDVPVIVQAARQLRDREKQQIAENFAAENYEIVSSFAWHKTMTLLKKRLSSLGNTFISELLQRPDIDEYSDILSTISDSEALSLARDLGMINATQAMRLAQSQQAIAHFAAMEADDPDDPDSEMTADEALRCLRVCVQSVLGQESIKVAQDFAEFRDKLESTTLTLASQEFILLQQSPYFFIRTTISVLLNILKTKKGSALEHASRNALLIASSFWENLKDPERWQIGQAYASEFAEGNRDSVKALHAVLLSVNGFDFVPENLRSNTFISVANSVVAAHQGVNNFYNEPAPMRELASLGSSIPGPAVAACITAVLCIKLGNRYGISWNAQAPADELVGKISKDRWMFYINGRLQHDRIILPKLRIEDCASRWSAVIAKLRPNLEEIDSKPVRDLVAATLAGDTARIERIGDRLWRAEMGL